MLPVGTLFIIISHILNRWHESAPIPDVTHLNSRLIIQQNVISTVAFLLIYIYISLWNADLKFSLEQFQWMVLFVRDNGRLYKNKGRTVTPQ